MVFLSFHFVFLFLFLFSSFTIGCLSSTFTISEVSIIYNTANASFFIIFLKISIKCIAALLNLLCKLLQSIIISLAKNWKLGKQPRPMLRVQLYFWKFVPHVVIKSVGYRFQIKVQNRYLIANFCLSRRILWAWSMAIWSILRWSCCRWTCLFFLGTFIRIII